MRPRALLVLACVVFLNCAVAPCESVHVRDPLTEFKEWAEWLLKNGYADSDGYIIHTQGNAVLLVLALRLLGCWYIVNEGIIVHLTALLSLQRSIPLISASAKCVTDI